MRIAPILALVALAAQGTAAPEPRPIFVTPVAKAAAQAIQAEKLRGHIRFLGHVSSADLPRWFATGDIFVSPASGNESFGIVLLEAMAAGRPVVATDIPGYRSVIQPGENAEAFPPGDVASLARVLVRLIEDPARRAELARRGRARALEFAWPRVTDRIEAVYRATLERRTAVTSAA